MKRKNVRATKISKEEASRIIANPREAERGLFYLKEDGGYVGIDNTTCDAWTEDFATKEACLDWLHGGDLDDPEQ